MEEEKSSAAEAVGQTDVAKRKRSTKNRTKSLTKVRLPEAIIPQVDRTIQELKSRGVAVSPDELLSEYLQALPEKYMEEQILQRTPEQYYLEAACQIPEIRERLLRQARLSLRRQEPKVRRPRKRKDSPDEGRNTAIDSQ